MLRGGRFSHPHKFALNFENNGKKCGMKFLGSDVRRPLAMTKVMAKLETDDSGG